VQIHLPEVSTNFSDSPPGQPSSVQGDPTPPVFSPFPHETNDLHASIRILFFPHPPTLLFEICLLPTIFLCRPLLIRSQFTKRRSSPPFSASRSPPFPLLFYVSPSRDPPPMSFLLPFTNSLAGPGPQIPWPSGHLLVPRITRRHSLFPF